jgi:ADP-ribose pyrophosphatase YjhB (NUDIX family)
MNQIERKNCKKGCCTYKIAQYIDPEYNDIWIEPVQKFKKAGCFIHDTKTKKILLVQSNGVLWGPPKGGIKINESVSDAAIREVYEETGLVVDKKELTNANETIIKAESVYYTIERDDMELDPQVHNNHNNDANGIGFFNIECLKELTDSQVVKLNLHCKLLIKKILGIDYFLKQ